MGVGHPPPPLLGVMGGGGWSHPQTQGDGGYERGSVTSDSNAGSAAAGGANGSKFQMQSLDEVKRDAQRGL